MRPRLPWVWLLPWAVGCGPVAYGSARADAEARIDALRAQRGSADAFYQLARAEAHLDKADEEAADGAYEQAILLARAAARRDARVEARRLESPAVRRLETELARIARNGAARCAPRALALARAHLAFARIELRQGDGARARMHLDESALQAAAASRLSPALRCAGADSAPPEPLASNHPFSAAGVLDVGPPPVRHETSLPVSMAPEGKLRVR